MRAFGFNSQMHYKRRNSERDGYGKQHFFKLTAFAVMVLMSFGAVVNNNASVISFLPPIFFLVAAGLAFATGTSWGTFAILVPIVVNMFAGSDETMMVISISAVLAGAVCGDHVSPISDTTIMSSSGAQCNHINHVQTQMQYAAVVIAACVIGYVIAGFTKNWWITLILSLAILTTILILIRKYTDRKYMQPDSSENA